MRLILFLACFAASVAAATHANALPGPGPLGSAWPAPVGHFQPRARNIPPGISVVPSQTDAATADRALDEKLKICRGC